MSVNWINTKSPLMYKSVSTLMVFMAPFLAMAEESSKRTFFAGRSFFFWMLVGLCLYFFYLYTSSRDKRHFLHSPFNRTVLISLSLFAGSFLFVNVFLSDQATVKKIEIVEEKQPPAELLLQEASKLAYAENHFTNVEMHYNLIRAHFEIPQSWKGENQVIQYRDDFDISNFYYNRLFFDDTLYVDIGRLGMGMISYYQGNYKKALGYLEDIQYDTLAYTNNFLARTYLKLEDTTNAILNFELACQKKNSEYLSSMHNLVELYSARNLDDKLLLLAINPETQHFIPQEIAERVYVKYNKIVLYGYHILNILKANFKITGFIGALGILIIWLVYMVGLDIFEKENRIHLLLTLIGGMIFSLLTFYISDFLKYILHFDQGKGSWNLLMFYIFRVGAVEEFVKIIPLLVVLFTAPRVINEPYDYILYAGISALGFSFVENLLYFNGHLGGIIMGRAMTSVPGHIIDSSIVAYGLVLAKYRYKNLSPYLMFPAFYMLGAITHGLYDFFLTKQLLPLFLFEFVFSLSMWIIIINNCLNNSPSFSYKKKLFPENMKMFLAISLLSILILQYLVVAWESGPSIANHTFNSGIIIGGIIIIYYADRLTSMDLVRGYWAPIPLRSIYEKQEGDEFSFKQFFLRIIAGNTMPHTFVGKKVKLMPDPANEGLGQYFSTVIDAEIVDRMVITCVSRKTGESYNDPYWFGLKTQKSIYTSRHSAEQQFVFKFDQTNPSFGKEKYLYIYLYVVKNEESEDGPFIHKKDLRPLGSAYLAEIS